MSHHLRRPAAFVVAIVAALVAAGSQQPRVLAQTSAPTPPALTFEKFHDYAAQVALIRQYARAYPQLVKVDTYGKSFQGRDLYILSVTSGKTGAIETKPAMWMDAGYDGGEIQTTEILLAFLDYLLAGYGKNAQITELLDRIGFYILPNGNPDAGEQFYQKPTPGLKAGPFMGISRNAWLKPVDDDTDGRLDEDPPEDLDGDGLILQMRVKDPQGAYVTDARDPRLMRARKPWDKGEWRLFSSEGIDSDGDGDFNEDWYGGYDSNRNAPANWDPARIMEAPAPYPLYLPEVKHFIDAILARPNIFAMVNMHQSGVFPGGSLWEAPTSAPPERFPDHDMKVLYPLLGREYERLMRKAPHSKATAMSVYIGYGQRGRVLSGVMTDYGYINLGILTWSPEHNVVAPDYNDDGSITDDERLRWNDTELQQKIFVPWRAHKHPQLGDIEIGGWRQRGLAPPEMMRWHAERITPWYVEVASMAPLVRITSATATALAPNLVKVDASVRNVGALDTNVTDQALQVRIGAPTTVVASIEGAEVVMGDNPADLGHLKGNLPGGGQFLSGNARTGEERKVSWLARTRPGTASVTITVSASRAGKHTVQVTVPTFKSTE